jgi:hypothetical protein
MWAAFAEVKKATEKCVLRGGAKIYYGQQLLRHTPSVKLSL